MRYLLGALLALVPTSAIAGGFYCSDACSIDPATGNSCNTIGRGCNPITHVCVLCMDDSHCNPGGTCVNFQCVGLVCAADAGIDGGVDAATDAGDDGGPIDAAALDAMEDTGADTGADAGRIDVAFPDAQDPTTMLPGGRGTTPPKDKVFDDGKCGCTTTRAPRGSAAWLALVFGLVLIRKLACRRGRAQRKCCVGSSEPG